MYVKNAPALEVRNNHLVGGRGGDAVSAEAGVAGATGVSGANGLDAKECLTPTCQNEAQNGGLGGTNISCPGVTNGFGGAAVSPLLDPQPYMPNPNGNGLGGSNGVYQHSATSQNALCKYDCSVPTEGLNGGAAQNGGKGSVVLGIDEKLRVDGAHLAAGLCAAVCAARHDPPVELIEQAAEVDAVHAHAEDCHGVWRHQRRSWAAAISTSSVCRAAFCQEKRATLA